MCVHGLKVKIADLTWSWRRAESITAIKFCSKCNAIFPFYRQDPSEFGFHRGAEDVVMGLAQYFVSGELLKVLAK